MARPIVRAPVPGTAADDQDMRRMHKPQELNVSSSQCAEEVYDGKSDHLQACIYCGNIGWIRRDCRFDMAIFARVCSICCMAFVWSPRNIPLTSSIGLVPSL